MKYEFDGSLPGSLIAVKQNSRISGHGAIEYMDEI